MQGRGPRGNTETTGAPETEADPVGPAGRRGRGPAGTRGAAAGGRGAVLRGAGGHTRAQGARGNREPRRQPRAGLLEVTTSRGESSVQATGTTQKGKTEKSASLRPAGGGRGARGRCFPQAGPPGVCKGRPRGGAGTGGAPGQGAQTARRPSPTPQPRPPLTCGPGPLLPPPEVPPLSAPSGRAWPPSPGHFRDALGGPED